MNRLLMKLRSLRSWLKNYFEEDFLTHLFVASIVATCLDVLSTWIALGVWPEVFIELTPLPYCMMKMLGLGQALIIILCLRVAMSYLLFRSTCRYRTRLIGLLVMTSGGLYMGIKNFYWIIQVLLV